VKFARAKHSRPLASARWSIFRTCRYWSWGSTIGRSRTPSRFRRSDYYFRLSRFSAPDGSAVPVTLVPVERFDSEFERLFDQCATGYRVLGVRDSEYLNWRYLAAPRRRQIPYAARSSGKLIGMAALEVFRDRAEIIDLFTFPQEAYLDGVLNALIAKAREKGCCVLTATCMSGSLLSRHLRGLDRLSGLRRHSRHAAFGAGAAAG